MDKNKNKIVYTTESKDSVDKSTCSNQEHEKDDYGCVSCFSSKIIEEAYK